MKYLSINQFCHRFQCSRSHFYRLVKCGQITIVKMGRASRVSIEEAESWAESLPTLGGAQ